LKRSPVANSESETAAFQRELSTAEERQGLQAQDAEGEDRLGVIHGQQGDLLLFSFGSPKKRKKDTVSQEEAD